MATTCRTCWKIKQKKKSDLMNKVLESIAKPSRQRNLSCCKPTKMSDFPLFSKSFYEEKKDTGMSYDIGAIKSISR